MSVASRLAAALKRFGNGLYRYESHPVSSWQERESAEQQALAELRAHPGFAVVQDIFDEEIRVCFEQLLASTEDDKALAILAKAQAIARMVSLLDGALTAKQREDWMRNQSQRQIDLLTMDRARRVDRQARANHRASTAAQA